MGKRSNWAIPYLIFLVLFVALPLVLVGVYAFRDSGGGFTFANITRFFTDSDALSTFAVSIEVAIENTAICLLLGYPAAYILARKDLNKSAVTAILFVLPMWQSSSTSSASPWAKAPCWQVWSTTSCPS